VLCDSYADDLTGQQDNLSYVNHTAGRILGLKELIDLQHFIQTYRIKEDGEKETLVKEL
jgi:hypothetical protein